MMMANASKRIKQGRVEIDYDESALIVHYIVEMVYHVNKF